MRVRLPKRVSVEEVKANFQRGQGLAQKALSNWPSVTVTYGVVVCAWLSFPRNPYDTAMQDDHRGVCAAKSCVSVDFGVATVGLVR